MKKYLLFLFLLAMTRTFAGEIVVHEGESIHEALRQAREWRRTGDVRCKDGITIRIMAGRYYMNEPLFIRPEDSGTATSPTIIRGEEGAILCGDRPQRHVQLWPKEGMAHIIDFNAEDRTITIPTPEISGDGWAKAEMVVHQRWAIAILRVKEMRISGDRTEVTFLEPESRLEFEHPWPQPVIGGERGNSSFLIRTTEQRDGIEQLVIIEGTEDTPVEHVKIENLTFAETSWNRPLHKGHVTLQGGFPLIDAYKLKEKEGLPWDSGLENQAWVERPVSAVSVRHARHVDVANCQFHDLGATALDYIDHVSDCDISGNRFEHIGGTAIMAGSFAESPREVHRPYTHLAGQCERITIRGNVINHATTEDWGAVGIGCGYVRDVTIEGNVVSDVNYSGICVGWGWTSADTGMRNNRIINNRVSNYACQLYDAGGIYTLSNQPKSEISDNEISAPYPAPYATNDRGFRIYLDAKTDGFTLHGNKTEGKSITRDMIGDNHPGPNLKFEK